MGCRVNGPGETDDADLGLWCGPTHVNLKRKTETVGAFTYDEILPPPAGRSWTPSSRPAPPPRRASRTSERRP